jgi:hypothetical protein
VNGTEKRKRRARRAAKMSARQPTNQALPSSGLSNAECTAAPGAGRAGTFPAPGFSRGRV